MNALLAVFLRSLVIFALAVGVFDWSPKDAYWLTIAHDAISLSLL